MTRLDFQNIQTRERREEKILMATVVVENNRSHINLSFLQ